MSTYANLEEALTTIDRLTRLLEAARNENHDLREEIQTLKGYIFVKDNYKPDWQVRFNADYEASLMMPQVESHYDYRVSRKRWELDEAMEKERRIKLGLDPSENKWDLDEALAYTE